MHSIISTRGPAQSSLIEASSACNAFLRLCVGELCLWRNEAFEMKDFFSILLRMVGGKMRL